MKLEAVTHKLATCLSYRVFSSFSLSLLALEVCVVQKTSTAINRFIYVNDGGGQFQVSF